MKTIVLQQTGQNQYGPIYQPVDQSDIEAIGGKTTLVFELKGWKAGRTMLQNRAIHLFCKWIAKALNDAGLDMVATLTALSDSPTFPWTDSAAKERLWRPVQKHLTGKESSTKLDKDKEVSLIAESLTRALGDKLGVVVPFPDKQLKAYEEEMRNR